VKLRVAFCVNNFSSSSKSPAIYTSSNNVSLLLVRVSVVIVEIGIDFKRIENIRLEDLGWI
jgi:hypothetical protein